MICPRCGKETNGSSCWNCGTDLRGTWQLFDLPSLKDGFFTEPPAGSENSTGKFSLPSDASGGGFTISLTPSEVSPVSAPAPEPQPVSIPAEPQPGRQQRPEPVQPVPYAPAAPSAQVVPQGFFLVPEPEKTLWGNFKRAVYKLLDYKGLVPALILLIFILGLSAGWLISRSGRTAVYEPESSVSGSRAESSAAESSQAQSAVSYAKTEEDPELQQYLADTLLPESGYLPNGQDVSAYDAAGIISAVNDSGQLTVFRMAEGDLQIDAYEKNGGQIERSRGTTSREFLKRVYDADGAVTVTADSKGVYLDGRQIWKHGLGGSLTSPVTICTCMKQQDAERWERAVYLFADSTNIRTAVPETSAPAETAPEETAPAETTPEETAPAENTDNSETEPQIETAEPETAALDEAHARALFSEKLREQLQAIEKMNDPDWDARFAFCYVDDDAVPELILDIQQNRNGYNYYNLYVIAEDAVVRLETAGGINELSVSERTNQVIESGYRAPAYMDYYFEYHIDGTELVQDYGCWNQNGEDYFINGKAVSREEYENERKQHRPSGRMTEPVWYHLDEATITQQCG